MSDLKPGWRRVKLGDVVDNVNDYYDRNSTETERYIAGEHIDEGSLLVRRWGVTTDDQFPPTFNRRFRAGDVLFHSRNLRKLACPNFDGVTGEKLFVLRVIRPDQLLPSLLPFLLQTRQFDEYVTQMWAGSTNKFLNKTPLMRYEFALPPLEAQVRIVPLMNAVRRTVEAHSELLRAHGLLRVSLAAELLSERSLGDAPLVTLDSACVRVGVGIASSVSHAYRESGIPIIRNTDIKGGKIETSEMLFVDPAFSETHHSKKVKAGDVVMTRTATDVPGDAAVVPSELDGAQTFTTLICTPKAGMFDSHYLCHWINGPPGRSYIRSRRGGAKQQNLGATFLSDMPIRLPSLDHQREVVARLAEVDGAHGAVRRRHHDARQLMSSILTEHLGP